MASRAAHEIMNAHALYRAALGTPREADARAKLEAVVRRAKEAWSERAAIREHEGGIPREEAESLAVDDVVSMIETDSPGAP